MQNGESIEKVTTPWDEGTQLPALKLSENEGNSSSFFDSGSFAADTSKRYSVAYGDVNGDGYLDALLIANDLEAVSFQLAIFDPSDPKHPYISIIGGTQEPNTVRIDNPGKITSLYGQLSTRRPACINTTIATFSVPQNATEKYPVLSGLAYRSFGSASQTAPEILPFSNSTLAGPTVRYSRPHLM